MHINVRVLPVCRWWKLWDMRCRGKHVNWGTHRRTLLMSCRLVLLCSLRHCYPVWMRALVCPSGITGCGAAFRSRTGRGQLAEKGDQLQSDCKFAGDTMHCSCAINCRRLTVVVVAIVFVQRPPTYRLACQTNVGNGLNSGRVKIRTKPK